MACGLHVLIQYKSLPWRTQLHSLLSVMLQYNTIQITQKIYKHYINNYPGTITTVSVVNEMHIYYSDYSNGSKYFTKHARNLDIIM